MCDNKNCTDSRILEIGGKCSDLCWACYQDVEHEGYVPSGLNIGGGDYLEVEICLACGKVQGKFPISDSKAYKALEEA